MLTGDSFFFSGGAKDFSDAVRSGLAWNDFNDPTLSLPSASVGFAVEPGRDQRLPVPTRSGSMSSVCSNSCFSLPSVLNRSLAFRTCSVRSSGSASRDRRAFSTCSSCSAGVSSRPTSLQACTLSDKISSRLTNPADVRTQVLPEPT